MTLDTKERVEAASELMLGFAERTGLTTTGKPGPRYLWTDAFAVCNFLGLARVTGASHYQDLALRLVEAVHHTLGRHRSDDARSGWISGLDELEGERHPTRGGLRIGKPLPERCACEAFDTELEWERDGQYFHYLTKWMHALDRVACETSEPRFNAWARELAQASTAAFIPGGDRRGIYWKVSIDRSRPLVLASGHHDALDGFVTFSALRASATQLGALALAPELEPELSSLAAMLQGGDWVTADPLGIGGLLLDGCRLGRLEGHDRRLVEKIAFDALSGLRAYAEQDELGRPATRRLAFRELGLALGLVGAERLGAAPAALRQYVPLAAAIEAFWLDPRRREAPSWTAHRDINEVMLATSLVPQGFLG